MSLKNASLCIYVDHTSQTHRGMTGLFMPLVEEEVKTLWNTNNSKGAREQLKGMT